MSGLVCGVPGCSEAVVFWKHREPGDYRCHSHGDIETPKAGRKDDAEKPRWDLLPWKAAEQVTQVLTYGAQKYAPENWRKVEGWRWRYFAAAIRHLAKWRVGEKLDSESGLPHLAHAACCVLFLLELDK